MIHGFLPQGSGEVSRGVRYKIVRQKACCKDLSKAPGALTKGSGKGSRGVHLMIIRLCALHLHGPLWFMPIPGVPSCDGGQPHACHACYELPARP